MRLFFWSELMANGSLPKQPSSPLIYGCMLIGGSFDNSSLTSDERKAGRAAIDAALENGINFFDHADIYRNGKSEELFGEFLAEHPVSRDDLIIQSKCGIFRAGQPEAGLPARYDLSYEHILESVDGCLRRLRAEYLDILLLHRPDPLVEPEEVAEAFDLLHRTGKVRGFGVSNHSPSQIELLRAYIDQPLVANQIEYNPLHAVQHDAGIHANMRASHYGNPEEGIIEYCRANGIALQAWSPLARGLLSGKPLPKDGEKRIAAAADIVAQIAEEHGTSKEAIVIAWILRHPAGIMPVVGTTNPDRIRACSESIKIELSRIEWYQIYTAAAGHAVP
jgi:predicted oxidoreductase